MKRSFPFALSVLGALVFWVSLSGGLPEPWGGRIGQFLSRPFNFIFEFACVGLMLLGPLARRETRRFRVLWSLGAGVSYAIAVEGTKRLVFWPRPEDVGRTIQTAHRGAGFPSGHTVPAFLAAALVGELYPETRWPALIGAILIGYSRVEVTAHFASQVWLSAVIGLGLGVIWVRVRRRAVNGDSEQVPASLQEG